MGWFIFWLLCAILGAAMLSQYNKAGTGLLLGAILGPIGLLFALVILSGEKNKIEKKRYEDQLSAIESLKGSTTASKASNEADVDEHQANTSCRMKKCPFCAELIKKEAIICRYCKSEQPKVMTNLSHKYPVCPNCEYPTETSDDRCKQCGYDL